MTDDELAMAYADGELDPIAAKRFERRMTGDAGLAKQVDAHRSLRSALLDGFAPVAAEPLPNRFTRLLDTTVVEIVPRRNGQRGWWVGGAMAASLTLGLLIGQYRPDGPVAVAGDTLVASGQLVVALDRQLGGEGQAIRVLASFRDQDGHYCRVFAGAPVDGIACRDADRWLLRQTRASRAVARTTEYRQAGADHADLLAAAQEMMAGDALDRNAERLARDRNWK